MSIGVRITKLRKELKLTQQELADKIGITRAALSHYEKDRREPDTDTLVKMSDFFSVTTDYLLGKTDDLKNGEKINSAFHEFEKLTEEEKDYLDMQLEIYRKMKDKNK
ncbi:helix-turn-helix domain-containing protein [Cytobacillus oceanisediminis]|uniref:helix-turn-helix domain-containing protein n=1 Tax=Cytobacillus oceanisediminis TaxID=665099 RepID=UPI001FB2D6D9|nr:helix-turn-helix transcriptional regulator [Cytobacillus oceanisediminis]UOE54946.1 helix-turn-helix transcriptional regulator [Cytobacillus oceanisediminis]